MSLLVVPLKPMAADMVVVVTTGSLIEEFLVNGKEASRLSIKSQKCTWNTTGSYSGIIPLRNHWNSKSLL